MQLREAVALITGGAQGFGKRFAESLLERGAKVIVVDIDTVAGEKIQSDSLVQFGENRLKFLKADLSNEKELKEIFDIAKSCFGRLDIVCNNAGMMTIDPQCLRAQVNLNLIAVMEGTYKAIELMSTQNGGDGGVVVNVASAAGIDLMRGAAVYTATKHGVVSFTRSFKFLPHHVVDNVRVNCICPYFSNTKLFQEAMAVYPTHHRKQLEKIGMVEIEDVAKGFMKCIDKEEMNAGIVVIAPPDRIVEYKIPMAKL